jgi:hypothetical protein
LGSCVSDALAICLYIDFFSFGSMQELRTTDAAAYR